MGRRLGETPRGSFLDGARGWKASRFTRGSRENQGSTRAESLGIYQPHRHVPRGEFPSRKHNEPEKSQKFRGKSSGES